ncbi:MAG: hypothetical protein ABSF98_16035 [Bryobacteraceae bacterium]|jgi:hypothetical protein
MKHRFLVYSLSHTWLVVDITQIGLPTEVYPEEGKQRTVPTLRFRSWQHVEQRLLSLGANSEVLAKLKAKKLFDLTIV